MSRTFGFHPDARDELREAVRFYEDARPGLGAEFAAEVRAVIHRLRDQPLSAAPSEAGAHRKALRRFPYSVIFLPEDSHLRIVAIMHHCRRPGYWKLRVAEG